ncbi:hypothetical protein TbrSNM41_24640 (plasmid) [Thermus brockianus]|uniref:Uncharacterized protein n=1 Tax=Thermus brockianus TaxID=56956 RepID=A0ABM7XMZ2_THEBO|nr:hypothetical protein TbrSNM41_24640 [Thermus brockianus]
MQHSNQHLIHGTTGMNPARARIGARGRRHYARLAPIRHYPQRGDRDMESAHTTIMIRPRADLRNGESFLLWDSRRHAPVCQACAEVCQAIADPDGTMRAYADACRHGIRNAAPCPRLPASP